MNVRPATPSRYVPVRPADLLADLAAAFPLDNIQPATLRVYKEKLGDIPPGLLETVVHELICTADRFPKISQIRLTASELLAGLPTETQALSEIEQRVRWRTRDEQTRGPAPVMTPEVAAAVAHVGGVTAFREAEDATIIRGQFARYYREIRAARIRQLQVGTPPGAEALESGQRQLAVS